MAYSNSSLVKYKKLSPNHSGQRTQPITKIAIHHMAGNCTIETCGDIFAPSSRQASSNYGIGSDGRIGMYVEEKNRAWTTSSDWCDQRAVTIEVADDKTNPWHCSDKAMNALVELCVDICQRNGIKKCTYTGGKDGVLQMHKWYANTDCPGAFLGGKFSWISEQVNKKLIASNSGNYREQVQKKFGFTDGTMKFLDKHSNPDALYRKLINPTGTVSGSTPKVKVQNKYGFTISTMSFLDKHSNPAALYKKLLT